MANFYTDNDDIRFLFEHMDLGRLARIMEEDFRFSDEFDFAPEDEDDATDNYRRILEVFGQICGDVIAPTAEESDQVGNVLNPDGTVTRPPGIRQALKELGQADVMGITLPYRFGGINCPNLILTIVNDLVSRADASLENIFGLQGIAETINAFADEEIKQEYLPPLASGQWTGAMVLTEPDAGSDLQAVKTAAYQDEQGNWFVHGVKRFITNGCGEVLLVLARTEPEVTDGRGLSLLLVEAGPKVKIRRLENKLGIHASPTCEIFFDHAPAKLIGERQRGLITYVMSLMNGARVAIAAQSLGIAEAAFRVARDYAHSRKQFDTPIENFPAIRELLVRMRLDLMAARALTYYGSYNVDIENGALRKMEFGDVDKDQKKELKKTSRKYGRWNKLLTPMSKYYASEMSMRVCNDAIAVLGGSGYMKDYALERHLRDSRITTIYEGTSQLQVIAAIGGMTSGTCRTVVEDLLEVGLSDDLAPMVEQINEGLELIDQAVAHVKGQPGTTYRDLYARKLVDMGIYMVVAALFCRQADEDPERRPVAQAWLDWRMPEMRMLSEQITTGSTYVVDEFETLAGGVPVLQ
jgi:hypothetical protein